MTSKDKKIAYLKEELRISKIDKKNLESQIYGLIADKNKILKDKDLDKQIAELEISRTKRISNLRVLSVSCLAGVIIFLNMSKPTNSESKDKQEFKKEIKENPDTIQNNLTMLRYQNRMEQNQR